MDLQTATPAEIDTLLAAIFERAQPARENYLTLDAEAKRIERAVRIDRRTYFTAADVEKYAAKAERYLAEYNAIMAECEPYDAEFDRRGGWTRAFLVLNAGGHLHRDMKCSTCRWNTRYGWLPEESGKDEAEIVDGAGADACTVCYPTAPVVSLSRPRRTLHRTEVEAQAARDERAAKKAEAEAKKAAKALVLDLRPYGVDSYTARIETLSAAKSYLTDAHSWGMDHPYYPRPAVEFVAQAVAEKVGSDAATEIAAAAKRAAKRR